MFSSNRISGDEFDGVYQFNMVVPAFSESGTWNLEYALLRDAAGNSRTMTATDVANAGMPTSFTNN